jgi:glycosyltransferase involved in cell wall biosynthesis
MGNRKILLLHWGQSGAGPRFLYELAREWSNQAPGQVTWSYDAGVEELGLFRTLQIPALEVTTYRRTKTGFAAGVIQLPRLGLSLKRFVAQHNIETYVCVMPNHFQSLLAPVVIPTNIRYVTCVHDVFPHPGETELIRRIPRMREIRRADQVVTFSESVARQIGAVRPGLSSTIIRTVLPAWDRGDSWSIEPRKLVPDVAITLGFFGRLYAYKGLSIFLEAARLLQGRGFDVRIEVHGQGPESVLQKTAQDLPGVWNTEWVPESEIAHILNRFDILVLPYTEASQSAVFTQALTYGIPCVGTPVGGLKEQLQETGAGVVATEISAAAVADAIAALVCSPALFLEKSKAAISAAAGSYTWDRVVKDIKTGLAKPE